jgi:osmoprotectant transport system permease protein
VRRPNRPAPSTDGRGPLILRWAVGAGILAALIGLDWLSLAPNRLLPGQPVPALQALGPAAVILAVLVAAAEGAALAGGRPAAAAILLAAVAVMLAATGLAADRLLEGRPPSARAMVGAGFWLALAGVAVLLLDHVRTGPRWLGPLVLAGLAAILTAAGALDLLGRLSLVVEYRARADLLGRALWQHLALSGGALALAVAITLPLGWAAFRSKRVEAAANAVLGATQVTPALALFGLLIPLLAALVAAVPALRRVGIGAIGPAPALLGVAVYLALPLLRGLVSGLRSADPAAVEAARAMGLTEGRITREVRIPLALPVLLSALRVATVQSIGLVTLGGLIGAGGLGAIVFEGMAQLAADLILLGAIPIVGLALAADGALGLAARSLERRRR